MRYNTQGGAVLLSFPAANRDEAVFTRPGPVSCLCLCLPQSPRRIRFRVDPPFSGT